MRQTLSQNILQKLQKQFGSTFVEYYDGDPWDIPVASLPCVIVSKKKTSIVSGATQTDRITHEIEVKVCLDKSDDFGASSNEDRTQQRLEAYAEGQNDAFTFDPESVLGLLRTDETLGGYTVGNKIAIAYDNVVRQPSDTVTAEVQITITCDQIIHVQRVYPPV